MMLVQAELVSHREGSSAIKCTWKIRHGMLARRILGVPKVELITTVYVGSSTTWKLLETYERVDAATETLLCDLEASLLYHGLNTLMAPATNPFVCAECKLEAEFHELTCSRYTAQVERKQA